MQCVWETESLKTQIHWDQEGEKKDVLDGERLETSPLTSPPHPATWSMSLEPSSCGQKTCVTRGLWVLPLGMGSLVPLRLFSLQPSPRPLWGRTCIIENAFQYLFTLLLLLWVAITVYIICLSVLPDSCSLLAEWFEEGEGGEKGETLTVFCHLR